MIEKNQLFEERIFGYPIDGPDDFSLYRNQEGRYSFVLETVLSFDDIKCQKRHILNIFIEFTKWMKEHNYDTSRRLNYHELFTEGLSISRTYSTVEETYAAFTVLAKGFMENTCDEEIMAAHGSHGTYENNKPYVDNNHGIDDRKFIERYIPSPQVKELLRRTFYTFSDRDKATIIYRSGDCLSSKHSELMKIVTNSYDIGLKEQILSRVEFDNDAIKLFKNRNREDCEYYLELKSFENKGNEYFENFDEALNVGKTYNQEFFIEKYYIDQDAMRPKATVFFDATGKIMDLFSYELTEDKYKSASNTQRNRFENHPVVLGNPFNAGDKVRRIGTDQIGTIEETFEEWEKASKRALMQGDWWDVSLTVDFPEHGHEHINPIFLEKVDS